jgi:nucleoid-associated protein YgaU
MSVPAITLFNRSSKPSNNSNPTTNRQAYMANIFESIKKFFQSIVPKQDHYEVVVRTGDTLYDICRELTGDGDRWSDAVPLNPGRDLNAIEPGDTIEIPADWLGH